MEVSLKVQSSNLSHNEQCAVIVRTVLVGFIVLRSMSYDFTNLIVSVNLKLLKPVTQSIHQLMSVFCYRLLSLKVMFYSSSHLPASLVGPNNVHFALRFTVSD